MNKNEVRKSMPLDQLGQMRYYPGKDLDTLLGITKE